MNWLTLFLAATGFLFCTAFSPSVDRWAASARDGAKVIWRRYWTTRQRRPEDLIIIQRLTGSIRAGQSLDAALSAMDSSEELIDASKNRLRLILQGSPPADFLSQFLHGALQSGMPVLQSLQAFQRVYQLERKLRLRAESFTSQCRAQAEVLSWLPWVMAGAMALMDSDWVRDASASSLTWLFLSFSLLLTGIGRLWIRRLLSVFLLPNSLEDRLQEEMLPELTLRLAGTLSLGIDAETALERSLKEMANPDLEKEMKKLQPVESVLQLRAMLDQSARSGAPLRDELLLFLGDLHLQTESRWEERVQRLPVVMLAPLFACFFPACLLVIGALMAPMMTGLV